MGAAAAGGKSEEEAAEAMSSVSDTPLLSSAIIRFKHSRNTLYATILLLDYITGYTFDLMFCSIVPM